MAGPSITPGVPLTPVDPTGTAAVDPTGRGPGDRRRPRAGRMPRAVRPEEPDDEDDRPPRPAPGRIDVIA
jgi:hypothetical protein